MNSKQLGWVSIVLALGSAVMLHFGVDTSPTAFVLLFYVGTAAAIVCATGAALRGSRWWFVAVTVIVLHTASLTWKIVKR
jgi:hypothetical protein